MLQILQKKFFAGLADVNDFTLFRYGTFYFKLKIKSSGDEYFW